MRRLAVAALLLLTSCVSMDWGKPITEEQLGQLRAGMNPAQVRTILGPPTSASRYGNVETWMYHWGESQGSGFLFHTSATATSGSQVFEFKDGALVLPESRPASRPS